MLLPQCPNTIETHYRVPTGWVLKVRVTLVVLHLWVSSGQCLHIFFLFYNIKYVFYSLLHCWCVQGGSCQQVAMRDSSEQNTNTSSVLFLAGGLDIRLARSSLCSWAVFTSLPPSLAPARSLSPTPRRFRMTPLWNTVRLVYSDNFI